MLGNGQGAVGMLAGQQFAGVADVFNNPELRNFAQAGFSALGNTVEFFSASLDSAFQSFQNIFKLAFDFVKFDIFTTLFQEIGLWFTQMNFPAIFEKIFHDFMSFVSLIWTFVLSITELTMFYLWGGIAVVLFIIWLIQKRFDPQKELTGPNTYGWENRGTLWLLWTRGIVTILTFLYLPCVTSCFNVMFCMKKLLEQYEMICYVGIHWIHFIVAFIIFIFIGIYFPWQIYTVINTYKPVPQKYDSEGKLIEDIDRTKFLNQYRDLMARDICPYNFLYCGYEYGWSAYKVITMVVKMLLVIPMTPLIADQGNAATGVSLAIVFAYAVTSCIMKPFILDCDDYIDLSSRITAVLTLVVQICLINHAISDTISGYLLTIINILNLIMMVVIFLGNMDFVKNFFRRHFGSIQVSTNLFYEDNGENEKLCRKVKIWQRFWRGLLANQPTLEPANKRLLEMEDVTREIGGEKYKSNLFPPTPEIAQCRRMARELEGVDVYYKSNDNQKSYWGRMYIHPMPFYCVIVYDENDAVKKIDDRFLQDFVYQNTKNEDIIKSRKFRQYLRCLNEEHVIYDLDIEIPVKHGCGHVVSKVHFHTGKLTVHTKTNDQFCHGFKVLITYEDGKTVLPDGLTVEGIRYVANQKDLQINPDFLFSEEARRLVCEPNNLTTISGKWESFIERTKLYRDDLEEWREEGEQAATWGFYTLVFENDRAPIPVIKNYILNYEPNKELFSIFEHREEDFKALETRLKYYDSHPAIAAWFNFFDDIVVYNSGIKQIKQHPELFDPTQPSALMYNPVPMETLKEILEEKGLRTKRGGGLFGDQILDEFEEQLERKGVTQALASPQPYVLPVSESIKFDPRCISTPLLTENVTFIASAAMMTL